MKRKLLRGCRVSLCIAAGCLLAVSLSSCKGKDKNRSGNFPENFNSLSETARVAYVMKNATPDSVARFICAASLGDVEGTKLDSLGIVTNYVYSNYNSDDQETFGVAYDKYIEELPLAKKMKLRAMAGIDDPQGLGYQLGLEYMDRIREKNMTVDEVAKELDEFKRACANDTATYERFLIGFRVVLEQDKGKDVNRAIYERFHNIGI